MAKRVLQPIISLFKSTENEIEEKKFKQAIAHILGERPSNLRVYQLAFRHTSASKETAIQGFRESNERLEYLGDSVLGMVVAEFLFTKYPYKDEGFLTEIRSRIVNRETLNQISRKLGLDRLIEYDGNRRGMSPRSSMYGDALEAFVGAIYLDKGFTFTRKFIIKKLLAHYDLDNIIQNNVNFKSLVIEWAQREGKDVRFEIVEERGNRHHREFISRLLVDDEPFAVGNGYTKKKAEQSAAEKACEQLELK
ncbi:ribonuclease III [Telluribacter sp.]|uniref:ribonuclease III n=1 Tax=Telluribacter sp. TaxID=1978767 RepID=UPI002E121353|nr:ribonuclease III [Telluribacter sp.]